MATNPYLSSQADAITNQANNNLMNYQLPSINSGAIAAGGFGGSRHGVAQGLAIGQTNQGITNSLAGLYGNAYGQDQQLQTQRDMQSQSLAAQERMAGQSNQTQRDLGFGNLGLGYTQANNQYSLGQGNLALGNKQADQSYGLGLGNLGLGQQQASNNYNLGLGQLGLGQYGAETTRGLGYGQLAQQGDQNAFNNQLSGYNAQLNGLNAMQNWNQQGVGMANQQQQLPLQNLGMLSGIGTSIGGQGGTNSQPGPSTFGSAAGGALTLAQLYQLLNKTPGG
jgi:hypothetical protein